MNDFEKICKSLDKGKPGCGNCCCIRDNYLCAKYAVNQYISKGSDKKDKNRLLLLKSECRGDCYVESNSLLITTISMAICALTLFFSVMENFLENNKFNILVLGLLILLILIIYCIMVIEPLRKGKPVIRWKPYILTAIEEIEKEMEKSSNQPSK